jgi:hypothetical protein
MALAFGLRIVGLGWGMPYAFQADEDNYLPGAIRMLTRGDLNPHYFANPPLLTYTVLAELTAYLRLGQILGFLHSAQDVGRQILVNPTPLYLMARMNGALAGTATVLLGFLIARRLHGSKVGLASALLLSVAFLLVRDSHYAVNDVPATFLLMVSFYFATRVAAPGAVAEGLTPASTSLGCALSSNEVRAPIKGAATETLLRDYLLGGLFLGLAVGTKYNVGLGAIALLAAHLVRPRKAGEIRKFRSHLPLVMAGIVSLLTFVAANPYSVLDYPAFLKGFTGQYHWASDPFDTTDTSMVATILRALSVGTSPIILVTSVLGLGLLAYRSPRQAILMSSFPLAYLAFFLFGSSLFYARFAMPLIPFVALLSGYGVVSLAERLPSQSWRIGGAVALPMLMALQPLVVDLKHDYLLRQEDTRLQLGRWIEENVPPGSKLAAEGYSFLDTQGQRTGPKKLEYSLDLPSSLRTHPLEFYVQEKFDYLIASSYVYGRYPLDPTAHQSAIDYYQRLGKTFTLVAEFDPTPDGRELPFLMDDEITPIWTVMERSRPGPTIKVYRVGNPPNYSVAWLGAPATAEMAAGQRISVPVALRNDGNLVWPSGGYTPVRVGYRWLDGAGREVKAPDLHSPLPSDVKPGDQVTAQVELAAPSTPGVYTLQLDLVWENYAWLSTKGANTEDIQVTVR